MDVYVVCLAVWLLTVENNLAVLKHTKTYSIRYMMSHHLSIYDLFVSCTWWKTFWYWIKLRVCSWFPNCGSHDPMM